MANNCLVTEFKKDVNSNILPKFGCFMINKILKQESYNSNLYIFLRSTEGEVIATSRNSVFLNNGASIGDTETIPANGSKYLHLGLDKGVFDIEKEHVSEIDTSFSSASVLIPIDFIRNMPNMVTFKSGVSGYLEDLKGWDAVKTIYFKPSSPINGNIKAFSQCSLLESLSVLSIPSGFAIEGDIASLGNLTHLTTVKISTGYVSGVKGNIEDFVQAQRTNGRTTCDSLATNFFGTNIKFNNAAITGNSDKVLSWTATTITYDGVTITA